MSFNFKEALEHSRTPEGKAEDFLKESLKVIKKMTPFNELSFYVTSFSGAKVAPYTIYSVAQNGNIVYELKPIQDYEETISIFQAIETELQKEGFSFEPTIPGVCDLRDGFKIII